MEPPDRPAPARSLAERVHDWVQWVGVGRLTASAVAALTVVAGGYWLVKPPAATTESKLPFAESTTSSNPANAATGSSMPGVTNSSTTGAGALQLAVVHVAGAVNAPGVYQLAEGSRVIDAVRAAGGLSADANPDAVNLAALVTDGQRVYVPSVGEPISSVALDEGADNALEPWPININSASAERLEALPGVGPATAAAIIAHRNQQGPFASVDQLADVRGIGPAKLEAIRALVTV